MSPSFRLLLLAKTITHAAARSLCDSWASCCCNRVISVWNYLPPAVVDFSSLSHFKRDIESVDFTQFWKSIYLVLCQFLCFSCSFVFVHTLFFCKLCICMQICSVNCQFYLLVLVTIFVFIFPFLRTAVRAVSLVRPVPLYFILCCDHLINQSIYLHSNQNVVTQ